VVEALAEANQNKDKLNAGQALAFVAVNGQD